MSTTVDERVVEMRFNNQQFEKNANETIKTLNKLDDSLELKGSTEGFDALKKSIRSVDLSNIETGLSAVASRVSYLGIIGDQTLRNLINKVEHFAWTWAKSLSIDQVSKGFDKYQSKVESVQTIMNATGHSIEYVSEVLERLNTYTDETSYSYSEMANSIGKFTSAGIDLDQAERAMEGIANWAAKAGVSTSKASTAFYNLSQAISTGALTSIDWKSLENISMTTMDVKEQFIEAGLALGKLKKQADGTIVTAKGLHKVTAEAMRDTLQYKWLDNEVLLTTLEKYADRTQQFGLDAYHAAQEAKTFKDAIDAVKDAVSTGWMNIFEKIFGNYEEARVLWTNVANELIEAFTAPITSLDDLLGEWHEKGGYLAFVESLSDAWAGLKSIVQAVAETFEEIFPKISSDSLVSFTEKIRDLTANFKAITTKLDIEDFAAPGEEGLTRLQLYSKYFMEWGQHNREVDKSLSPLTDTLRGLFSILSLLKNVVKTAFKFVSPLVKLLGPIARLASVISAALGRLATRVAESIENSELLNTVLSYLERTVAAVSRIIGLLIDDFTTFIQTVSDLPAVKEFVDLLGGIVFYIKELASPYLENVSNGVDKFVTKLEELETSDIYDFINKVAKALADITKAIIDLGKKIWSWLGPTIVKVIALIYPGLVWLGKMIAYIYDLVLKFIQSDTFQRIKDRVLSVISSISNRLKNLGKDASKAFENGGVVGILEFIRDTIKELWKDLREFKFTKLLPFLLQGTKIAGYVSAIIAFYKATKLIRSLTGLINNFSGGLNRISVAIKSFSIGLKLRRTAMAVLLFSTALTLLSQVPIKNIWELVGALAALTGILTIFSLLYEGFISSFAKTDLIDVRAMKVGSRAMLVMAAAIFILAKACQALNDIETDKLWEIIGSLTSMMAVITVAVVAIGMAGRGIRDLGIGLLATAAAVLLVIYSLDKIIKYVEMLQDELGVNVLNRSLIILAALMGTMFVLAFALKKISKAALETAAVIFATGAALFLVAFAVEKLMAIEKFNFWTFLGTLGFLVLAITALVGLTKLMPDDSGRKLLGLAGSLLSIGLAVLALVGALALIHKIGVDNLKDGVLLLSWLCLQLGGVMALSSIGKGSGKAGFIGMAISVAILVAVLKYLSTQDFAEFYLASVLLGKVLLSLGLALRLGGRAIADAKVPGMLTPILMTVAIAAALGLLAYYIEPGALMSASTALGKALIALGVSMKIGEKGFKNNKWHGVWQAVVMVIAIAGVLWVLSIMDFVSILSAAGALALSMLAISKAMTWLSTGTKGLSITRVRNVLAITLPLILEIGAVLSVLAKYSWDSLLSAATAISMVMGALTGSLIALSASKTKFNSKSLGAMVATMLAVLASAFAGLWAVTAMIQKRNLDPSSLLYIATSLSETVIALSMAAGGMALIGKVLGPKAAEAAGYGAAALGIFVGALLGLVATFAIIENWFDVDMLASINRATEIMGALGSMFGEFIGNIAASALSALPKMAEDIAAFIETISGALSGIEMDESAANGVSALCKALLAITGAEFIDKLSGFLGTNISSLFGGNKYEKFADGMVELARGAKAFGKGMEGVNTENIESGAKAIEAVASVASKMHRVGGILQKVIGTPKDLGTFADELGKMVGPEGGLTKFANEAPNIAAKEGAISSVTGVIGELVNVASALDKETELKAGDWLSYSSKARDLGTFAAALPNLGTSINSFYVATKDIPYDFGGENGRGAAIASAIEALVQIANAMPEEGELNSKALWGAISIDTKHTSQSFTDFVNDLSIAASSLMEVIKIFDNASLDGLDGVTTRLAALTSVASSIKGIDDTRVASKLANDIYDAGKRIYDAQNDYWVNINMTTITSALNSLSTALTDNFGFEEVGSKILDRIVDGFSSATRDSINTLANDFGTKLSEGINSQYDLFVETGKNATQGFVNGVLSLAYKARNAGMTIAEAFKDGVQIDLDINSPSRVMMQEGSYAGEGFVLGIKKWLSVAGETGSELAATVAESAEMTFDYVNDLLQGNNEVDMTIRPVIDLSGVQLGMSAIDDMFAQKQAILASINGDVDVGTESIRELVDVGWKILKEIQNGSNLYLDDGVLAGRINRRLGRV